MKKQNTMWFLVLYILYMYWRDVCSLILGSTICVPADVIPPAGITIPLRRLLWSLLKAHLFYRYVFRYCTAQTGYKWAIYVCLLLLCTYIHIYIHAWSLCIYIYICRYVTYSHLGVDRTWTLQNILTNGNDLENPIIYVKMTTIYLIIKQK